jgi:hypothetical protein
LSFGVEPEERAQRTRNGGGPDGVRDLAAAPASRDRYVDFLRAFAIVMVVIGHWLAVMINFRNGRLGGSRCSRSAWTHWLTWLFQVMGIFF